MGLFRIFGASSPVREEDKVEDGGDSKDQVSVANDVHEPPKFDPIAVLESANIGPEQRERVDRTLELLRALPAETPSAIRKSIVEASLKAFDISIKAIVEAATNEVAAFDAFIASGRKQLGEQTKQGHDRIAQLEAEIGKIRKKLEIAAAGQASLDKATNAASERVRPVLGFFSAHPPRVAHDSQKGHPPSIIIDESLTRAG